MTTTHRSNHSRARFVLSALTSSALLAAGGTLAPALVTSASATEQTHRIVHRDARRDVLLFDSKSETSTPAPRDRATDIVTTVVDHRARRIVLESRARQVRRSGYRLMVAEILASDGKRYELVVDYSRKPIDSRISLERSHSAAEVECPGATWSIDPSVERVEAAVPNSCLGDPGWVRVGLALVAAPHNLKTSLADDSRTRGHVGDRHLELGPRQHRA
jgi:hypothetical protein